jgi:plasmid stabilization system protein ParE
MSGYSFHPAAFADLDNIWESIAENNTDAADRVVTEIYDTIRDLVNFLQQGHRRTDLTTRPLRFPPYGTI